MNTCCSVLPVLSECLPSCCQSSLQCLGFFLQILVYEGEMERAQGQLEAEMQNLEEEKNRVIEEAFIRAESEMKAVHENLAGQTVSCSVAACDVQLNVCLWTDVQCICVVVVLQECV